MIDGAIAAWKGLSRLIDGAVNHLKSHSEAKLQNASLVDENVKLREERRNLTTRVAELEGILSEGPELVFRAPVYWSARADAENPGPFCPKCYISTEKAVPMFTHNGGFRCTNCSIWYPDPDEPPTRLSRRTGGNR